MAASERRAAAGASAPRIPSRQPPRHRAIAAAGLALGALALATAIVFIAVGEEGKPIEITGVEETREVLAGIREEDGILGSPAAPVTISLFNDLQCTDCASYQLEVVPPLVEDLVRGGEASLELRHFPLAREGEPGLASYGAVAAAAQSAEWPFAHLVLLNLESARPRGATEEFLRAIAGAAGIDVGEWADQLDSPQVAESIEADLRLAAELRLPSEPAVIVDGPGGTRELLDSPSAGEVEEAVGAVR